MSVKRNAPLLEASEALNKYRETFELRQQKKLEESAKERAAIEEQLYFGTAHKKAQALKEQNEYRASLKNEVLKDAIKGIYIGALSEGTALTQDGMNLADALVENYIKESGGASTILSKISGKTYALDYLRSVVEGTYESLLEDGEEESENSEEDNSEDVNTSEEIDEDIPEPEDGSAEDRKSEMYDDLQKDEDITNAVNLIAQRITDAEEEFIRKNNEDKKALEDIAQKFSDRIKKVEDDATVDEEDKEELQQESSRLVHRITNDRRENRTRNVFEQVVINLTESIIKNEDLKEQYTDDLGKLDMGAVVESAKCIYGFLETVNTLQLQRVDARYIEEALSTM